MKLKIFGCLFVILICLIIGYALVAPLPEREEQNINVIRVADICAQYFQQDEN